MTRTIRALLFAVALVADGTAANAAGTLCRVDAVRDGDSLRLVCDGETREARLYCIDAPEIGQRPWGRASRHFLRRITPSEVRIQVMDTDRYARQVVLVTSAAGGENLNLAMVRAGQAAVYRRYCTAPRFAAAETEARRQHRGIWSHPGGHQRPWEYRHAKPFAGADRQE
ncbi:micrococcal nuclease-like nuclease [Thioflavicoccus mobilis 8321]|uniref:Micrococcal nuclease-like nuclease n=1 Tax=Thioflavicoccus mobilis 8321 TaxID=765912 RepID=L0H0Z0_9GAMM|nr:thermonuclease family protein [Thioflavicoccus mobilis]AGA91881.1 micrococcal nuclease-like nuclease [Thioflavicoccus mobilis 8321]